jgi:dipeptidyl aminopeptidase/acylaminoacyl peptidase
VAAIQTYVDLGFAVCMVNYRCVFLTLSRLRSLSYHADITCSGSSGYGRAFRESLCGHPAVDDELSDIAAGLRYVTQLGIADPRRAVLLGRAYGGCVDIPLSPSRWTVGF